MERGLKMEKPRFWAGLDSKPEGFGGVAEEELLLLVEQNNYNPHVIVDEIIKLAKLRETDDNATVICNLIQRKDIPGKA